MILKTARALFVLHTLEGKCRNAESIGTIPYIDAEKAKKKCWYVGAPVCRCVGMYILIRINMY